MILDVLCETSLSPMRCEEEKKSPTSSYSICHIRSLSLVSRRLRQLALPRLFASVAFTRKQRPQLRLLEVKCSEDTQFAALIRSV
jgi:hypothetical protein